jgi:hypothetical protein
MSLWQSIWNVLASLMLFQNGLEPKSRTNSYAILCVLSCELSWIFFVVDDRLHVFKSHGNVRGELNEWLAISVKCQLNILQVFAGRALDGMHNM